MEHLKEITQKSQMRRFIEKVYDSLFKYALLNCTMIKDAYKRSWMIGAFMQAF